MELNDDWAHGFPFFLFGCEQWIYCIQHKANVANYSLLTIGKETFPDAVFYTWWLFHKEEAKEK